jgi:tungstate transport system permease protein
MHDFVRSLLNAFTLPARFDPDLIEIVALSLRVSLSASLIAMLIGAPLGAALAVSQFRGRQAVVVLMNALLGLHPSSLGLQFISSCRVRDHLDLWGFCLPPPRW